MTKPRAQDNKEIFNPEVITQPPKRGAWKRMLPLSLLLLAVVLAAWYFSWDAKVVTAGVLLFGAISNVFVWILGVIGLVPFIGPLIVKVLSLSIIWLLNAIGYMVSFVAIKRGYSKDVLTYRGLTVALIIGIIIGYVLGNFL
ncbi:MAG: hypothetical protein Q8J66_07010 [Methylotenera sp.]|nr:hypothetical protein [Methylotenera sp.]